MFYTVTPFCQLFKKPPIKHRSFCSIIYRNIPLFLKTTDGIVNYLNLSSKGAFKIKTVTLIPDKCSHAESFCYESLIPDTDLYL